jgi:hypothetical protein
VKRFLLSALAVAGLLSSAVCAHAQPQAAGEMKPLAVFSLSSYGELESDLKFLGEVAGAPELAQQLDLTLQGLTQGQGLAGLDKKRPWGAAVLSDGMQFQVLTFLPVTDLDQLLASLAQIVGEPEDLGDGVLHLHVQQQHDIYIKQQNGWAFFGYQAEQLTGLPEDPAKLLGDLPRNYDVALRANIQNIPQAQREFAIDMIKQGAQGNLQQMPDESDEQYALRAQLTQNQLDAMTTAINDLNELTLGWSIDAQGKRTYFDVAMTMVEGSESARQLAATPTTESKLSGFLLPGAVFKMHVNSGIVESDIQQTRAMLATVRNQVMNELDNEQQLPDGAAKEAIKELVGQVMDVLDATVKQGQINMGMAVVGSGPFTVIVGAQVADGGKLDNVVKKLVQMSANEPGFPEVKLDIAKHKGIRFHSVTIPYPDDPDSEKAKKLLGDELVVTLGFGPHSVYVALGPDALGNMKQVIDKSAAGAATDLPPMQIELALAPLMKFASEEEGSEPMLAMLAKELADGGKDLILITQNQVPGGVRVRFEAQEGILKLIGAQAKQAAAAGGVGAF